MSIISQLTEVNKYVEKIRNENISEEERIEINKNIANIYLNIGFIPVPIINRNKLVDYLNIHQCLPDDNNKHDTLDLFGSNSKYVFYWHRKKC